MELMINIVYNDIKRVDIMFYLNVDRPVERFKGIANDPLYVDKSLLIDRIASTVGNELGH